MYSSPCPLLEYIKSFLDEILYQNNKAKILCYSLYHISLNFRNISFFSSSLFPKNNEEFSDDFNFFFSVSSNAFLKDINCKYNTMLKAHS